MTPRESTARLILYVAASMLGSASAGLSAVNFSDVKEVTGYALGILTTGIVTARSYVDKSPAQVKPGSAQP